MKSKGLESELVMPKFDLVWILAFHCNMYKKDDIFVELVHRTYIRADTATYKSGM